MSSPTAVPEENSETAIFNIPAALFPTFPGRPVILRTADPGEPRALLGPDGPEGLAFIQVTGLAGDMTSLADWGEGIPLDLCMADPLAELPRLYCCTGLLARHPLRVTVPFRRGVAGATKLALALGFAVRLHGYQPTPGGGRGGPPGAFRVSAQPYCRPAGRVFGDIHEAARDLWADLDAQTVGRG